MNRANIQPDYAISGENCQNWFDNYNTKNAPIQRRIDEMDAKYNTLYQGIKEATAKNDRRTINKLSAELSIVRDLLHSLHTMQLNCL
jgi:peptidoglycan hydrolase CwlO-like protein